MTFFPMKGLNFIAESSSTSAKANFPPFVPSGWYISTTRSMVFLWMTMRERVASTGRSGMGLHRLVEEFFERIGWAIDGNPLAGRSSVFGIFLHEGVLLIAVIFACVHEARRHQGWWG